MSYEMKLALRRSGYSYPFALTTHESVGQHLVSGLGQTASLVRLAEQLDEVVVAYNIFGEDQLGAHQSVVDRVGNLVGQLALQAAEVEVQQLIRYGLQAGGAAALSALGMTSKQKTEVMLFASGAAFVGGYLLGELKPIRQPILRAVWDIYRGWLWYDIPPPQPGLRPVTG